MTFWVFFLKKSRFVQPLSTALMLTDNRRTTGRHYAFAACRWRRGVKINC